MHFLNRAAAIAAASTLLLTACGAVPANVPTATAVQATPTAGDIMPTATAAPATPDATAAAAAAAAVSVSDAPRPYAKLSPAERGNIATQPPALSIDVTKKYIATISTAKGNIVVELDPSAAPNTVNNFVYLANNGFYDGLIFHRVEPGFVIQGGDPAGNGAGGPGYDVPPEIKLKHIDGAIAMARTGGPPETTPNSGSQFYITLGAQPNLDNNYTSFGHTLSGMDVAKQIAIGDKIERIDVVTADGSAVATAPLLPTAPPPPTPAPVIASCNAVQTNVTADDHVRGNPKAATTIIEYADLQCPSCAALNPSINTIYQAVSDTVRFVYRHFPLVTVHDKAFTAALGAEAAQKQGKFQEFVDALYERQSVWATLPAENFTDTLKALAGELSMNSDQFITDLSSPETAARVQHDIDSGNTMQVASTPSLYVDGQPLTPAALADTAVITELHAYAKQRQDALGADAARNDVSFKNPETVTEKNSLYVLTVKTSKGDIEMTIDTALAPLNANAVVFLAQKGYYDNSPVIANTAEVSAVIFSSTQAQGNPGFDCSSEGQKSDFSKPGTIALNPLGAARNTTELVIMYGAGERFNGQLTAVGRITAGLEIAQSLQAATKDQKADRIISVTVRKV